MMNALLGAAGTMGEREKSQFAGRVCADGEAIELAFRTKRDSYVFTDRRFIVEDVHGMTGRKRNLLSVPYERISAFSIETAGFMDRDGELRLWVSGLGDEPLKYEFRKSVDVYGIQAFLASKLV